MWRERAGVGQWVYQVLYRLLLLLYAGVVAGLCAVVVTWPHRPIASLADIPWWSHTIALVLVAVTWAPVSGQISRGVHQLAFGERDNAYEVVERVHQHLHAGPGPDELLPTLAATLAHTLKLPYVSIETGEDTVAAYGSMGDGMQVVRIPLRYQGLTLGTLSVSARRRFDGLSSADLRLLDDLAGQVGITLYAARLSEELQTSREKLVTAREEERLRIRRDLHDGLGPTLASLGLQLGALHRTLRTDSDGAERLVKELRDDVREATAEIRRLVYELRPPMLDEFGLIDALRNLRPVDGLSRSIRAPGPLPALPAAVEVAIYRIAAEALHNAARHAEAGRCVVELTGRDDTVTLTVTDDGRGLPADYLAGVGHRSMRERATELGGSITIVPAGTGGTRVTATFPIKGTA